MITIILGIILFIGVLVWDVKTDYNKWLKGIPINHTKEAWIRAAMLIPSFLLLFLPTSLTITGLLLKPIVVALFMSSTYLLFFDGFYNKHRNFNWWFLGGVDDGDAWTDVQLRKLPLSLQKLIKIGLPILFAILYVILL
jgi:hypothetical protein